MAACVQGGQRMNADSLMLVGTSAVNQKKAERGEKLKKERQ